MKILRLCPHPPSASLPPWASSLILWLRPNFYSWHLLYFIFVILLGGAFLHAAQPSLPYIDCLYAAGGSLSGAGFMFIDPQLLSPGAFVVISIIMLFGNMTLISITPPLIRRMLIREEVSKLERYELIEYKALKALIRIVLVYVFAAQLLGFLILLTYTSVDPGAQEILQTGNQTAAFFSAFVTLSAYAGVGFTPDPNNMMVWSRSPCVLLVASFLTLAGNPAFPLLMRLIVWCCFKLARGETREVFRYLLEHPRRCFVYLFLQKQTLWLLLVLFAITSFQMFLTLGLAWNSEALDGFTPGEKVLNSFFSAIVTRASGFNSINIGALPISVLILFGGMMYISTIPVAAAVRLTNARVDLSEVQRLGKKKNIAKTLERGNAKVVQHVLEESGTLGMESLLPSITIDSVRSQAAEMMADYSMIHFLILLVICLIEEDRLLADPDFTVFAIMFELASAVGGVGLSLGYPGTVLAFSSVWSPASKILLIIMMISGRQRGLPTSLDSAVQIRETFQSEKRRHADQISLKEMPPGKVPQISVEDWSEKSPNPVASPASPRDSEEREETV